MWADQLGSLPRDLPPPPQYMLSLYNSVTDKKAPNPYEAKVIRSYTDKGLCPLCYPLLQAKLYSYEYYSFEATLNSF